MQEEIIIMKAMIMIMISLLPPGTGKSLRTKRIKEEMVNSNSNLSKMEEDACCVEKRDT